VQAAAVKAKAVYEPDMPTTIELPTAPLLHTVFGSVLVSVRVSPAQRIRVPPGVTVGTAGIGFITTVIGALTAEVQPKATVRAE
jgi:hypothetical protein